MTAKERAILQRFAEHAKQDPVRGCGLLLTMVAALQSEIARQQVTNEGALVDLDRAYCRLAAAQSEIKRRISEEG